MKIEGQAALVTGGAAGLRAQAARRLSRRGVASIPFPKRRDERGAFAPRAAAVVVVEAGALNGEAIRPDGALRTAPR